MRRLLPLALFPVFLGCPTPTDTPPDDDVSFGDDDASADDDDVASDDDDDDVSDDDVSDDDVSDDDVSDDDVADDDVADDDDVSDDDDSTPVPANGVEVPNRAADETMIGDLSDGAILDLDWAQNPNVTCWTASENLNWTGAHVITETTQGEDEVLTIRVTPGDSLLDVSLWAAQTSANDTHTPPDLPSVVSCETSYDAPGDSNPGFSEAVLLSNYNPYRVLIGVAGADGFEAGAYTLEIWRDE